MKLPRKPWLLWIGFTLAGSGLLSFMMIYEKQQTVFLPGETSHGHDQIEIKCSECHTPFMGVLQDACLKCHKEELIEANDSHPEKNSATRATPTGWQNWMRASASPATTLIATIRKPPRSMRA